MTRDNNNPMFNSGLNFLIRVNNLMDASHILKADSYNSDEDLKSYLRSLDSIYLEVYPRVLKFSKEDADKLTTIRDNAIKGYQMQSDKELFNYHLELNIMAQKHKLLLNDAKTWGDDDY